MNELVGPITTLICLGSAYFFFYRRLLRYMQFLQQEDYESSRFLDWLMQRKAFDRRGSLISLAGIALDYFVPFPLLGIAGVNVAVAAGLAYMAEREEDPRTAGKLALKMTERAKRIFNLACTIFILSELAVVFYGLSGGSLSHMFPAATGDRTAFDFKIAMAGFWLTQLVAFFAEPLILVLANALLEPYEKDLQEGFANEARAVIGKVHPFVIGITGSYGKTSSKVLLTDILNSVAPTFTTPRSINSYMGVTREIRERMKPQHKYAVIEMGAYYTGSIKRMCTLTPPNAAIVTAVGAMHLERFGSQENVFKAKSELPEALPKDGILVINGDYEYCRKMADNHKDKRVFVYGLEEANGHLDAYMYDLEPTDKGTNFSIRWQGKVYTGSTSLLGKPMLSNALATFTMACVLGLNPELVLAVIKNVKTESNRLEPQRAAIASLQAVRNGKPPRDGNILRLNDAYNSNPQGFNGALEVLQRVSGKRKVLVTPGMIELGERQFEENKNCAKTAAAFCDLVIVVGGTNKQALVEGLNEGGLSADKLKQVDSMREALNFLAEDYCIDGDVVLIENDLPDLYEAVPTF
ncbi:MAG: UDP-N-acetylmuramoyl-tripeptide--D-alanyl-D-alanine ligase [Cyanobacteria bacterium SZAS-4]|nr:UDP-N-acetylmuramoyl-tripeptide--D-alanyl-D-alanine ligase [Cyanobacteria bacterium SZAS-4]